MNTLITRKELIDFCLTFPDVYEDYPFDDFTEPGKWAVMRHRTNKKSFAYIFGQNGRLCVNLKCDPMEADFLRRLFKDVTPGYHMNKTHWNTVMLGGDVADDVLRRLIKKSYELIVPTKKAGKRI